MSTQPDTPARPAMTVLIVAWNAWHYLGPCLRSIAASDFRDCEILVIDNASMDGTADSIEQSWPTVRLVRNRGNVGHTRAINQGFDAARGRRILVLDADTELAPDVLGLLNRYLDEHQDVELAVPRVYNTDGTVQESARNFPGALAGLFGRQSLLTRWFPGNPISRRYLQRDLIGATEPFCVESVASTCMLLPKALVDRLGKWDEGFPGYFVETDWCFRLRRAGIKVVCVPAARIVHHEGNSRTRRRGAKRIWMFHWGALRFYRKNFTLGWLDPRTLLALAGLSTRAALLIAADCLKADRPATPAPQPAAVTRPAPGEQR